jgi:hypothetical protein
MKGRRWGVKIVQVVPLIDSGGYSKSQAFKRIIGDIEAAVLSIRWPPGNSTFTINPAKHGNGVAPIKLSFLSTLKERGWTLEKKYPGSEDTIRPGAFDGHLEIKGLAPFVAEWETGNVSSSHRAMNKMAMGVEKAILSGGILVLSSRGLYPFLTDRIGNFDELRAYLSLWSRVPAHSAYLGMMVVEHDKLDMGVEIIPKGDDGRAKEYQRRISELLASDRASKSSRRF